jgi:integrase
MATIRKRGNKYQVQIRRTGQTSTSRSFHLRSDALAWARQTELKADRRELPADPKVLEHVTLGDLVERYRDTVTPTKRGHDPERIVLTAFLRHLICRKTLAELQTADFAAYRDERLKHVLPSTLKRQLSPIHNLFELARDEWGLPIRENPLDKLTLSTEQGRRERRLREGEFDRLIEAARSRKNPYVLPIIILAVETGMRRGEILAIQSEHFDAERRTLLIPQTKNGHSRTIPLSARAIEVLSGLPTGEARLFPLTANAFRLTWERVKSKAGIDDLHFHDLRHEAVSRFFEKGLAMPEVALISGHRDPRMLFRYTHPIARMIADKLDA